MNSILRFCHSRRCATGSCWTTQSWTAGSWHRVGLSTIPWTRFRSTMSPRNTLTSPPSLKTNPNTSTQAAPLSEKRAPRPKQKISPIRRVGAPTTSASSTHNAPSHPEPSKPMRSRCIAYCTARQYDLGRLKEILVERGYRVTDRKEADGFLHAQPPMPHHADGSAPISGDVFFFKDGSMVCWDMAEKEEKRLLLNVNPAELDRYEDDLVDCEEMNVVYDSGRETTIYGDDIVLGTMQRPADELFAKLAFSHGLTRSTQLGVLENHLEKYLESIEYIPIHMMKGYAPPLTASNMMRKHGQLLYIRGLLNLHTDLVDAIPELYWSRNDLAKHFESISRSLDVLPRIRVLNQRLDHADRLVDLMNDHLSKKHGTRMEWIIIALIAVEVVFEVVHYLNELKYVDLFGWIGNKRGSPYLPIHGETRVEDVEHGVDVIVPVRE